MSVRMGLLAILTLGPAYGHQLHAEFGWRAVHRTPVNVGQIYATIDRLTRSGLIASAGSTPDSLPLHRVTESGRVAATEWMSVPSGVPALDWTEMLDQLVITATVDRELATGLAAAHRRSWSTELAEAGRSPSAMPSPSTDESTATVPSPSAMDDASFSHYPAAAKLAVLARQAHAVAVLAWLGSFVDELDANDTAQPYSTERPKRGRPRPVVRPE